MNSRVHRPVLCWPYRLVAAALAALFLATGAADAYGLHRCPHHDGLPGAAGVEPAHAAGVGQAHAASGDRHAAGAEPAHGGGAGQHDEHGPCTCIGACGVASAALPVHGSGVQRFDPLQTSAPGAVAYRLAPSLDRDYLLPYANAPPSDR